MFKIDFFVIAALFLRVYTKLDYRFYRIGVTSLVLSNRVMLKRGLLKGLRLQTL
jgi:hypothetical protein